MLIDFFLHLKARKLPVSTREFLTVLEGLRDHVCGPSIDDFYFFARTCLVKDESLYDRFDQAFGEYFKGVTTLPGLEVDLPEDWLRAMARKHLSPEERAKLERLGWDTYGTPDKAVDSTRAASAAGSNSPSERHDLGRDRGGECPIGTHRVLTLASPVRNAVRLLQRTALPDVPDSPGVSRYCARARPIAEPPTSNCPLRRLDGLGQAVHDRGADAPELPPSPHTSTPK